MTWIAAQAEFILPHTASEVDAKIDQGGVFIRALVAFGIIYQKKMSATGLVELYEAKRDALQFWYDYTHSRNIHGKTYERGFDQIVSSFKESTAAYVQDFLATKPTVQEVGLMWRAAESYSPEKELLQKEGRVLAAEWRKQFDATQQLIQEGKMMEAYEAQQKLFRWNE